MNGHLSISVSLKDTPEILRVINLLQSLLPVEKPKLLPPLYPNNRYEDMFLHTHEPIETEKLRTAFDQVAKERRDKANEVRRKKALARKQDPKTGHFLKEKVQRK